MSSLNMPTSWRVCLDTNPQASHVPDEISKWLHDLGWYINGQDPNYGYLLFVKPGVNGYFVWSEAVSYEAFRFLTIGAHT